MKAVCFSLPKIQEIFDEMDGGDRALYSQLLFRILSD